MTDFERLIDGQDGVSDFVTRPTDIVPRFDPVAYFEGFCHKHSVEGPPMQYGNVLIFPDGWTYSAVSHDGPETEPPEDSYSLLRLRKLYWTLRRRVIVRHFQEFKIRVENLIHLQQFKSAPLMASRVEEDYDGETGAVRYRTVSQPINLELLEVERERIQAEVDLCERTINEINKGMKSGKGVRHESTSN